MSPFLQFDKYLDYLKSSIMKADEKSFYYLYIIHSDNSSLEQKITSIVELINLHRNNFNGYCTIGELYYFISLFDQIKEKNEEYKQKEKVVYNEIIIRLQEEKMKYEATSIITIAKKVFLNDMEELKLLLDFDLSFYVTMTINTQFLHFFNELVRHRHGEFSRSEIYGPVIHRVVEFHTQRYLAGVEFY